MPSIRQAAGLGYSSVRSGECRDSGLDTWDVSRRKRRAYMICSSIIRGVWWSLGPGFEKPLVLPGLLHALFPSFKAMTSMTYRVSFSHEVHQIATCYETTAESSYQVVIPGVWTCFKLVVHASNIHYLKKDKSEWRKSAVYTQGFKTQSGLVFKVTSQKHILLICIRNQPEKSFCIDFDSLNVSGTNGWCCMM